MKTFIDRVILLALVIVTAVLAATAMPALVGGHLEGKLLMAHMMASGALVIGLPVLAIWFLGRSITRRQSGGLQRLGYWTTIFAGTLTIATVFLCMLPYPSTGQMHELMEVHGYAGFAMVPAVAMLLLGFSRWRRIQSTRSATPG